MSFWCRFGMHPKWSDFDPLGVQRCLSCGYARTFVEKERAPHQHQWTETDALGIRFDGDPDTVTRFTRHKLTCQTCGDIQFRDSKDTVKT